MPPSPGCLAPLTRYFPRGQPGINEESRKLASIPQECSVNYLTSPECIFFSRHLTRLETRLDQRYAAPTESCNCYAKLGVCRSNTKTTPSRLQHNTKRQKRQHAEIQKTTVEYKTTPGPPRPVFFCIRMVLTKASLTTSNSFENADKYKTTLIQYKNTPCKYKNTPLKYTRTPFCTQLLT